MTMEKRADTKNGILRLIFVALAVLLEALFLIGLLVTGLHKYAELISIFVRLAALILVLAIYSQKKTASIKMPWIILILVFPTIGVSLYLLIGLSGSTRRMKKRYEEIDRVVFSHLPQDEAISDSLHTAFPQWEGVSRYICRQALYPVYRDTEVTYFEDAAKALEAQKEAIRGAKQFIFMEYFAIEDRDSWRSVEELLEEKVREGVEVRVFYDDVGSAGLTNTDFAKKLQKKGIRSRVFNPMTPLFNMFLNNRDHRKMTIVDNKVAFTGGYNIANEYFNVTSPFGHWKDTGVRLEGDAVRAMTLTFLEMWNAVRADDADDANTAAYVENTAKTQKPGGFVQFYADNPMDKKPVGEDVYLGIMNRAERYLYIMTPYLIITDEMSRMLGNAAKRGVDVRIVTPGIPDKKLIYQLTRSYYNRLAFDGVRIFEYTPGFCHAKMCVADDTVATCGTINLDYRSFYHHFEDGCLLVGCGAVTDIRKDFDDTFRQCREVTEKYRTGRSAGLRFGQLLLRLFAPLL
ncbi:MAG: cardiolipin synthase [Lachnospiraceae bacterium]|nr:cardiolipin synthase [Lachnospiraceae bacterium]